VCRTSATHIGDIKQQARTPAYTTQLLLLVFPQQTTFTPTPAQTRRHQSTGGEMKKGFNSLLALVAWHPWKQRNKKAQFSWAQFSCVLEKKKVSHVGRNYSNTRFAPAHGRNRYNLQIRKYQQRHTVHNPYAIHTVLSSLPIIHITIFDKS